MNITKTITTIGIASAMTMQFSACKEAQHENPLLAESQLPYGAPDFSKIQVTDYLPAFETATGDFLGQLLTHADGLEILQPQELRDRFQQQVESILQRYQK